MPILLPSNASRMQPLLSPSDLIAGSWDNFRKNFRTYATFTIWYTLIAVLEWAIWTLTSAMFADLITRDITFAVLSLPDAFAVFVLSVMMIEVTAKGLQNKTIDLRTSFSNAFHKVFPFIWVIFLLTLLSILGVILLVIPFFIFIVWFRFVQNAVIIDDARGLAAFKASKRLVDGRWLKVAARIFIPVIFFGVAVSFIRAIIFLIAGTLSGSPGLFFSSALDITTMSSSQGLIITVLPQIITAFSLPLFVGSDLMLWMDLKRRT